MTALAGLTLAVTRATGEVDPLSDGLAEHGATIVRLPMLRLDEPTDPGPLAAALARLDAYDAVAITSRNGLRRFAAAGRTPRRLVVSGSGSAEEAAALGLPTALVPRAFRAEGIVAAARDAFGADLPSMRWLLLRAEGSRAHLPEALRAEGCVVDDVPLYSVHGPADPAPLRAALDEGVDLITVTSGRAGRELVAAAGDRWPLLVATPVATIGPVATAACREAGLTVVAEANPARLDALVDAVVAWRTP